MMPRWYREQYYRHNLGNVLNSPLSDIKDVKAAKQAIRDKLQDDKINYNRLIQQKARELKKLL